MIEFHTFCKREADERNIRAVYDAIDVNHDGLLTKEEIIDGLTNNKTVRKFVQKSHILKPLLERSDFDEIFSKLDTDSEAHSKNKVDYVEFWKFCKATAANLQVQKMKAQAAKRKNEIIHQREVKRKAYMARLTTHISHRGVRGSYYCAVAKTHMIPLSFASKPYEEVRLAAHGSTGNDDGRNNNNNNNNDNNNKNNNNNNNDNNAKNDKTKNKKAKEERGPGPEVASIVAKRAAEMVRLSEGKEPDGQGEKEEENDDVGSRVKAEEPASAS